MEIGRIHVKMRALQLFILLIVVDDVGNGFLLDEAALIDRIFSQIWLDDIQSAEVPSTMAIITHTGFLIMMVKVGRCELGGGYVEILLVRLTKFMIMLASLCLHKLLRVD